MRFENKAGYSCFSSASSRGPPSPDHLAQTGIERLNRVDGVNHLTDLRRIIKDDAQPGPVVAPGFADTRCSESRVSANCSRACSARRRHRWFLNLPRPLYALSNQQNAGCCELDARCTVEPAFSDTPLQIASGKPLRISAQAIRISLSLRFFSPVRIPGQNSGSATLFLRHNWLSVPG